MSYAKSKASVFITLFSAGILFAACNSSNPDSTTSDTSTEMYTPVYPDSMQEFNSTDTSNISNRMKDTSASINTNATPSSTTTSSSINKKGKATVAMMPVDKNQKVQADKSGIYDYADVMPSFPGGQNAIDNFVTNNIQYTDAALDNGTEGRIAVSFTVDQTGSVTNAHTVGNKLGDGLDEEAVKVVSSMPKWNPGNVKGKAVKTKITLPITFQIEE